MYHGFSINPLSLPLSNQVYVPKNYLNFEGLFGVFSDSLPDEWGRLLMDRVLKKHRIDPESISSLTRLCLLDNDGQGGLDYRPQFSFEQNNKISEIEQLAHESIQLFTSNDCNHLDELVQNEGSTGGTRPKAHIRLNNESWIVKFPTSFESRSNGRMEYEYMQCAKNCGIQVPDFKLLPSRLCDGFFAVKRFDRNHNTKIHMISVSGLLETSHRYPNLDYSDLMKLTLLLTQDHTQLEEMYRRMCFNVFAHNRDDHSKNFAFVYNEQQHRYQLSPAYDLTFNNSIGGEHATTINGNGKDPDIQDILSLANEFGMKRSWAETIADQIHRQVNHDLYHWIKQ